MKKLLLLASAVLIGFGSSLSARTLVTNDNIGTQLTADAIITLQCMDGNGGNDYYFNGKANKTDHLTSNNFYKLIADPNGGFKLQRLNDPNEYVGNNAANTDANGAITFNISIPENISSNYTDWKTKSPHYSTGTNTVRFTAKGTNSFLNSQGQNAQPNFAGGKGGYSYWRVFTYTQDEVDNIKSIESGTYTLPQHVVNIPAGKTKIAIGSPVTAIEPGKYYMLYNNLRNKYVAQTANPTLDNASSSGYNMVERAEDFSNSIADNIPFLFQAESVNETDRQFDGESIMYLKSAYGTYFELVSSGAYFSPYPRDFEVAQIGNSENVTICDKAYALHGEGDTSFNFNDYGYASADAANHLVGWSSGDSGSSFKIYPVEFVDHLITVTVTYPEFCGQNLSLTYNVGPGQDITELINAPEYFTQTGIAESDHIVSATNKTFNVTGTWDFPFTLNRVFRADLRRSSASNCTKWTVNNDHKISTRSNTNAEQFDPKNLFYLKGEGFNGDNRLLVTLHSLAYDDAVGFSCGTANNAEGSLSSDAEATKWIVKLTTQSTATDPGIALQHSGVNAHMNDIAGILGIWNNPGAENTDGSFIRFFDLTDSDFATESYEKDGNYYLFNADAMATAKANPTSENVRAAFTSATLSESATLTVNLTHNERTIKTVEITNAVGTKHTIPTPDFFNDVITVSIPTTTSTINYALTQLVLPFKHTETTDNMIWQAVNIKPDSNNKEFVWTYNVNPDNENKLVADFKQNTSIGFTDEQLWAFVGNMVDGFKIYNKAAGMDKWLYKNGDNAIVGNSDENCYWKPAPSVKVNDSQDYRATNTYCCLTVDPTVNHPFINLQSFDTELKFWSADQGSTHTFIAPAEPLIATAADFIFGYEGPTNAVGGIDYNGVDFTNGPAIITAATEDKYDLDKADDLRNLIALYNTNVTVKQFVPNAFYRIVSAQGYDAATEEGRYLYTGANDLGVYGGVVESKKLNYHTLFSFEPKAGATNRYYIHSQGLYFGHAEAQQNIVQVEANGNRGEYALEASLGHGSEYTAMYSFNDLTSSTTTVQHYIFNTANDAETSVTGWGPWVHESHFYILAADDIDVELEHELNDQHIGFGYFPFPISTTDKDTQFYTIHESNDKTTGEPVLTYAAIDNSVPAYTPVMIGNKNLSTITLAINSAAPANTRRRVISTDSNNTLVEGTRETDTWTTNSWTKTNGENLPAEISALNINHADVRYMDRTITITDGGDVTFEFQWTTGRKRLDICGVMLINANGDIVAYDCHIGFAGNPNSNNIYKFKVSEAGNYTLRYYAYNSDANMDTNGNIFIDFVNKDKSTFLVGHLREKQVAQGDFVIGTTTSRAAGGLGFVKLNQDAAVKGNYVTLPASNLYHPNLADVTELPLVDRATTTDIQEISGQQNVGVDVVYDLQGRRLAAPVKGFNIINGRKVYIR